MTTLEPSFFIRSSSFLWVTRICIKASMSLNLSQIPLLRNELAALDSVKNLCILSKQL